MAIFRKLHTSFWSDSFTQELDAEKKLFYLYLMTNERTKQCGIYEITLKQICFDLDINKDKAKELINHFVNMNKIKYSPSTNEIALKNWAKYNNSTSPKVKSCINKELEDVKDRVLIQYLYSMDTQSQQEEEQEQEEEENKNKLELYKETVWRTDLLRLHSINLEEYERHLNIFLASEDLDRDWKDVKIHWKRWLNKRDLKKTRKIIHGFKDIPEKYLPKK